VRPSARRTARFPTPGVACFRVAPFLPCSRAVQARPRTDCRAVVVGVSDPDLGTLLCRLLREDGYDTTLATDGIAIVSRIARTVPDVLVLDTDLDRLDGLLTLEVVRSITAEVPVVLLSVVAGPALRLVTERLGAVLLRKPFRNFELLDAVARECGSRDGELGASG
jgi:DNA-binding response OmpR family regulator